MSTLVEFPPIANDGAAAPASVSVGATSTAVLAANDDRYGADLVNDSDENIYLGFGQAAIQGKGAFLTPNGGSYDITPLRYWRGTITAICASGSKSLTVQEFSV